MLRTGQRRRRLAAAAVALVLLAACGADGPPSGGQVPTPSGSPGPTAVPSAPVGQVASAAQAAALVMSSNAAFGELGPPNPELIGVCCWYEAAETAAGYDVTVNMGWGDCEAGCISRHTWLFRVDAEGTITLVEETGDPPEAPPVSGPGPADVRVHMRAGPTCPVQPVPPAPGCEPRQVGNADLVLRSPVGAELARATSNEEGLIELRLPAGAYYVEPQPVEGLMGVAPAVAFAVVGGSTIDINVDYDTGIR